MAAKTTTICTSPPQLNRENHPQSLPSTTVFHRKTGLHARRITDFILRAVHGAPRITRGCPFRALAGTRQIPALHIDNEGLELNSAGSGNFILRRKFKSFFQFSAIFGIRKPDEGIYKLALEVTQRRPEECLFIDDRELNLECAQHCTYTHPFFKRGQLQTSWRRSTVPRSLAGPAWIPVELTGLRIMVPRSSPNRNLKRRCDQGIPSRKLQNKAIATQSTHLPPDDRSRHRPVHHRHLRRVQRPFTGKLVPALYSLAAQLPRASICNNRPAAPRRPTRHSSRLGRSNPINEFADTETKHGEQSQGVCHRPSLTYFPGICHGTGSLQKLKPLEKLDRAHSSTGITTLRSLPRGHLSVIIDQLPRLASRRTRQREILGPNQSF